MRRSSSRIFLSIALLTAATAAWAHPALFDGGLLANLTHLLTQQDHLLLLAGIGVAAGIVMYITPKRNLRGNEDDENQ